MRKNILFIISGFMSGWLFALLTLTLCNRSTYPETKYVFIDSLKNDSKISFYRDSIYEDRTLPFGITDCDNGVIPNATDAVNIAEIILFNIYGKENIIKQRPYEVEIINNRIWNISGHIPDGREGGCFNISMDKITGHIFSIWHEK